MDIQRQEMDNMKRWMDNIKRCMDSIKKWTRDSLFSWITMVRDMKLEVQWNRAQLRKWQMMMMMTKTYLVLCQNVQMIPVVIKAHIRFYAPVWHHRKCFINVGCCVRLHWNLVCVREKVTIFSDDWQNKFNLKIIALLLEINPIIPASLLEINPRILTSLLEINPRMLTSLLEINTRIIALLLEINPRILAFAIWN